MNIIKKRLVLIRYDNVNKFISKFQRKKIKRILAFWSNRTKTLSFIIVCIVINVTSNGKILSNSMLLTKQQKWLNVVLTLRLSLMARTILSLSFSFPLSVFVCFAFHEFMNSKLICIQSNGFRPMTNRISNELLEIVTSPF